MITPRSRKVLRILCISLAGLLFVGVIAVAVFNPSLTRYVEGPAFRAELEKQTAKGLHFPSSTFGPIKRTGFLSAGAESFKAENGRKAMTAFHAHGISARFNPLGVFLRRWQLDELHIDGGEVGIQVYEPKPEPSPAKPWYHIVLPDRVYLKRVWSEPADVTWMLRNEKGGIYGTRLSIAPHGRDFEYRGTGGTMKMALIPDLEMRHTHMLITKERFSLYQLDLASGDGLIHAEGTAGMRDDKHVDFKVNWEKLPVREWLPAKSKGNIAGAASGHLHWTGNDMKLNTAAVRGALRVRGGRVSGLPFLEQVAAVTKRADLEELELDEGAADLEWAKGKGELKNIALEDEGKFRVEGAISIDGKALGGSVQLGLARAYLEWLPNAEEIFTRERKGYLWTTVKLSGTLTEPKQDLSPRVLEALQEEPGSFFGAAFRALGEWLDGSDRAKPKRP